MYVFAVMQSAVVRARETEKERERGTELGTRILGGRYMWLHANCGKVYLVQRAGTGRTRNALIATEQLSCREKREARERRTDGRRESERER